MIMLLELLPLHYSASTLYLLLHRFITYKPSYIKSLKMGNQKLDTRLVVLYIVLPILKDL